MSLEAVAYAKDLTVMPLTGEALLPSQKLMLMVLADYHNKEERVAYPSMKRLARESLVSRRHVITLLQQCVDGGILAVRKRQRENGGPDTNHYRFLAIDPLEPDETGWRRAGPGEESSPPDEPSDTSPGEESSLGGVDHITTGSEPMASPAGEPPITRGGEAIGSPKPELEPKPNRKKNGIPPTAGADAPPPPDPDSPFGLFWDLCQVTERDLGNVNAKVRTRQCGIAKTLLEDYPPEDIRQCIRYLATETWREKKPTMATVKDQIDEWIMDGRPEEARPRGGTHAAHRDRRPNPYADPRVTERSNGRAAVTPRLRDE